MRPDHFFAERFQSPARRDHLHQHVRAIGVGLHHFFNGLDLAFNFPEPDDERPFLQTGAVVFNFHGNTFNILIRPSHPKRALDATWGVGVYGSVFFVNQSSSARQFVAFL
jgi:hypothetical protein